MNFNFELEEVNYILQVLSARPYVEVKGLIDKIQLQAQSQLANMQTPVPETKIEEEITKD